MLFLFIYTCLIICFDSQSLRVTTDFVCLFLFFLLFFPRGRSEISQNNVFFSDSDEPEDSIEVSVNEAEEEGSSGTMSPPTDTTQTVDGDDNDDENNGDPDNVDGNNDGDEAGDGVENSNTSEGASPSSPEAAEELEQVEDFVQTNNTDGEENGDSDRRGIFDFLNPRIDAATNFNTDLQGAVEVRNITLQFT